MSIEENEGLSKEQINEFCNSGAEIFGSVAGASIGFLLAGPFGGLVGAAATSPLTSLLKKLGSEVSNQIMAPREKIRIGATYHRAALIIENRLLSGEKPRDDGFFDIKKDDRSSASTILEGILQKAKEEHEEKKLPYYSAFLANITFDESIDSQKALTFIKIIDRLSYQQLCILSYIKSLGQITFENWNQFFQNNADAQVYFDFYFEIAELFEMNLLKQFNGKQLGGFHNGKLTLFGLELYNLMALNQIPAADTNPIKIKIDSIGTLIKEN
ncbi:hypothetical protein [Flavobacterium granuli]|uniref:EcsC protein family protein n=1 Tax=Flavobacterium granuli TaxID=280093 RepID=A0ABU1RX54_9FLAO|nr:hypothetical protein [Flavobacterium granuli]MDR6843338.1 hypothetical protein [Flavobacterium granuli]